MSLSMLTPDSGLALYSDDPPLSGPDFAPTVQVLNIRKMASNGASGADRYRLVRSYTLEHTIHTPSLLFADLGFLPSQTCHF